MLCSFHKYGYGVATRKTVRSSPCFVVCDAFTGPGTKLDYSAGARECTASRNIEQRRLREGGFHSQDHRANGTRAGQIFFRWFSSRCKPALWIFIQRVRNLQPKRGGIPERKRWNDVYVAPTTSACKFREEGVALPLELWSCLYSIQREPFGDDPYFAKWNSGAHIYSVRAKDDVSSNGLPEFDVQRPWIIYGFHCRLVISIRCGFSDLYRPAACEPEHANQ